MREKKIIYYGFWIIVLPWFIIVGTLVKWEFGTDVDSWYLAGIASRISTEGVYIASRLPGFPVYELILSMLIPLGGYLLSNLFSTFFALVLAHGFFLQIKREGIPLPLLATSTLLFFPLVIISASSTLDYLPALGLMWISYSLLFEHIKKRNSIFFLYISALVLGISAGFRLTALGFLLPALIYLWKENRTIYEMGSYILLTCVSACIAFLPVILGPGLSLPLGQSVLSFSYHINVFIYNGIMFWGVIPGILLCIGIFFFLYDLKKRKRIINRKLSSSDAFHVSVLVVYTGLLFLLPDESSYLLPLLPSTLLLMFRYMRKQVLWMFFIGILCTHIIRIELKGGESGQRTISPHVTKGLVWQNYEGRKWRISLRTAINQAAPAQPTLLMMETPWVTNWNTDWQFDPILGHYKKEGSLLYLGPYIFEEDELNAKKKAGYRLCVWREQKWEYYAMGLEHFLGREIEVIELGDILPLNP